MADYPPQLYVTHGGKYYINAFSSGGSGSGGSGGTPHWVELGRTTLSGTSDNIDVTAGWATSANSGTVTVDGNISVTATSSNQTPNAWYDLGSSASTSGWVLRFKVVYDTATNSNTGQAEGFQVGLFDSYNFTAENPYQTVDGAFMKTGIHAGDSSADHGLQTWDTNKVYTGAETGLSEPYSATRYFELKRDGNTMSLKVFSDEYSTQVGSTATDTITASNFTDLQYINVRLFRQGCTATNTYVCSDMKFWNNTTDTSNDPTHDFNSTSGFTSGLTAKPYLMILSHYGVTATSQDPSYRLNNDSSSNYARRGNSNGSEFTVANATDWRLTGGYANQSSFDVGFCTNTASEEKIIIHHGVSEKASGASTSPDRMEIANKWCNTSDSISSLKMLGVGSSGNFTSDSEVIVLGFDPADTEGTNVWEELASATGDGSSGTLSASFTSKKYLMIEAFTETSTGSARFRVGNSSLDSGNNYATRISSNGGSEDVTTSHSGNSYSSDTPIYWKIFMINKSDKEKLWINQMTRQNSAGSSNTVSRVEEVGKWANTSNQADIIGFVNSTGNFTTNSFVKIWGFD